MEHPFSIGGMRTDPAPDFTIGEASGHSKGLRIFHVQNALLASLQIEAMAGLTKQER